jgi:hypothetical protein
MTKVKITEIVFKNLPVPPKYTAAEVFPLWWKDTSKRRGFRLTDAGETAFQMADIEGWIFNLDLTPKINYYDHLLKLNEVITCPYHIYRDGKKTQVKLKVYDSKVAMMIGLYGSVAEYLELQNHKRRKRYVR